MKNILIVTNLFGNNRQGYDLADCLRLAGHRVRLVQYSKNSDKKVGNIGVRFVRPHGVFSKIHVLINVWHILAESLFCKKDIVVCIGKTNLFLSALYKLLFRSIFVYYSLEYTTYGYISKWIVRRCVDKYIDVEDTRMKKVMSDLSVIKPSLVVNNMPKLTSRIPQKGKLKSYLKCKCQAKGDEKLIVYAGSYQKYSCLKNVINACSFLPENVWLILMVPWGLPEDLSNPTKNCKIVPPQDGDLFFDWLSDADCALLPYEDESDFNVTNCSPQKLFDCYYVGVPYLASRRPLIMNILGKYPKAGVLCDFTNITQIVDGLKIALRMKNSANSKEMYDLYRSELNYSVYHKQIQKFVCDEI